MSKIVKRNVVCACCGQEVMIERVLSGSAMDISLSGNAHNPFQYMMEECPECHYTSLDIEDTTIRVSIGMLNSFRLKPEYEKLGDPSFLSILRAADVYEKNKEYNLEAYVLRLASFYAEEQGDLGVSRDLLRQANDALEKYFTSLEEYSLDDISSAVYLVDGNRRLGMVRAATIMCNDLLDLLSEVDATEEVEYLLHLLKFEKKLLENRDIAEHMVSEAE